MKRYIKREDRKRHVYISGKTQYGKSTLIQAMAYQDMRNGDGLCVIDAKGNLIPKLLQWVPEHRKKDCIYLDLKTPIPIDFMACNYEDDDEVSTLVSDIAQIFERLDPGWGARMKAILLFTVTSLSLRGDPTFLDIYHVLTDEAERKKLARHPAIQNDPIINKFWNDPQGEKYMKSESTSAIAFARMGEFIVSRTLRTILGTPNAKLDFDKAVEERKIILVQLKPNSDPHMLYGSLIVSKIQQAIFRRDPERKDHPPFMLYVDEFQNFKSSGFEKILSEAGGLGLCLTLANQYFDQLDETKVEKAIINSVSTFFLFRMNPSNAGKLAAELTEPPPPPPSSPSVSDMKKGLRFWKEREHYWGQETVPSCTSEEIASEWQEASKRVSEFEHAIEKAQMKPPPGLTFLAKLVNLKEGQTVYRAADGTTTLIKVPWPPDPKSVGKTDHTKFIKQNTIDIYAKTAEPGQNSAVPSFTLHSQGIPHSKGNDHRNTERDPEAE